jgi:hypothetical protein
LQILGEPELHGDTFTQKTKKAKQNKTKNATAQNITFEITAFATDTVSFIDCHH